MNFLKTYESYISQEANEFYFTDNQIYENLNFFESDSSDDLFEHWWNTLFDFGALIPGIGSIFEGINLVSYAKQGEYLLAGLCAIGLIPIFGQYIGAGGSLLIKGLKGGGRISAKILSPVASLIGKYFPKITKFFKSPSFVSKFKGISKYTDNMATALKDFSMGKKTGVLAKIAGKRSEYKRMVRVGKLFIPSGSNDSKTMTANMDPRVGETVNARWEDFLKSIPSEG